MLDQYGQLVPADLRALPIFYSCHAVEIEVIFEVNWYEVNGILLAYLPEGISGDDPCDVGLTVDENSNLMNCEVFRVADCLKRGNPEDGFYHA